VDHYRKESISAGDRFAEQINATVQLIRDRPMIGHVNELGERQFKVETFPYNIVYQVEPRRILVLAIAHHKRKPGYWRKPS
jgi:plasmid stabilization system protein ParE